MNKHPTEGEARGVDSNTHGPGTATGWTDLFYQFMPIKLMDYGLS